MNMAIAADTPLTDQQSISEYRVSICRAGHSQKQRTTSVTWKIKGKTFQVIAEIILNNRIHIHMLCISELNIFLIDLIFLYIYVIKLLKLTV